MLRLHLLHSF
ncbi:hypothetical protein MTR67_039169 [Solanum verrucosum]|uniref:Uncharacterized protein n=1 Tax=Solanum verrucosum TaxID=315347 RepID=A0AAF0ZQX7_SOLVR|nr:hypothetical protein MTR67_039169 [Solanum verrucosum]